MISDGPDLFQWPQEMIRPVPQRAEAQTKNVNGSKFILQKKCSEKMSPSTSTTEEMTVESGVSARAPTTEPLSSKHGKGSFNSVAEERAENKQLKLLLVGLL
jgi:hypothetical protein